jgi:hypothetical protein
MEYNLCITDTEVNNLITQLQRDDTSLSKDLILKAIASCCEKTQIIRVNNTFTDCVKERIRMLKLM